MDLGWCTSQFRLGLMKKVASCCTANTMVNETGNRGARLLQRSWWQVSVVVDDKISGSGEWWL